MKWSSLAAMRGKNSNAIIGLNVRRLQIREKVEQKKTEKTEQNRSPVSVPSVFSCSPAVRPVEQA
jgi:hypothetical protein